MQSADLWCGDELPDLALLYRTGSLPLVFSFCQLVGNAAAWGSLRPSNEKLSP